MDIDAVVKLGGSLIKDGVIDENIKALELLRKDYNIIVVIGGGELADGVRSFDSTYGLSESIAHLTAIKCMDLNTEMVKDISSDAEVASSVTESEKLCREDKLPLLKTYRFMNRKSTRPSWEITSDSISALVADDVGADEVILVKDVEGIYSGEKLVKEIKKEEADKYSNTCIDGGLIGILHEYGLSCSIISGKHPERVDQILKGEDVRGTRIC